MWQTESIFQGRHSIISNDADYTDPQLREIRYHNEPESDVVEVRGEDGLFQQGRIVDCTEEGLLIDWECAKEPAAHFIRFGHVYLCKPRQFYPFSGNPSVKGQELIVEVLLRRSPREPWTWYPGTLLAGSFATVSTFGLVNVVCADGTTDVVVPGHWIRQPRTEDTLEMLRVHSGHFVKDSLLLETSFSRDETFEHQVLGELNRSSGLDGIDRATAGITIDRTRAFIRAVSIEEERLHYIRIGYSIVPRIQQAYTAAKMDEMLELAAAYCGRPQEQHNKRKWSATDLELSDGHELHTSQTTPPPTCDVHLLPRNILARIFEQLNSADQARLRRVCAYWDWIAAVSRVARVLYHGKKQDFTSVASLYHGWTSQTEIIINAGVDAGVDPLFCGGQLFAFLAQKDRHAPMKTMMLANVAWSENLPGSGSFAAFLESLVGNLNRMVAACQTLLLRNVRIQLVTRRYTGIPLTCVHFVNERIAGMITVQELWSRLDSILPLLAHAQLQQIRDWIASDQGHYGHRQRKVVLILEDRQSSDPRDDAYFRGRKWTEADLASLDLGKLSSLTLHTLVDSSRQEMDRYGGSPFRVQPQ